MSKTGVTNFFVGMTKKAKLGTMKIGVVKCVTIGAHILEYAQAMDIISQHARDARHISRDSGVIVPATRPLPILSKFAVDLIFQTISFIFFVPKTTETSQEAIFLS